MKHANVTREALLIAMLNATKVDDMIKLCEGIATTVLQKNHDYGDAWQRYGIFTPLIRINDKTLRLKTLGTGEQAMVANETITDTLRDIIGYATLALLWLNENVDLQQHPVENPVDMLDGIPVDSFIRLVASAVQHENDD